MTRQPANVHLIPLPLPDGRTVNVSLVMGCPLTLVDTGLRTDESIVALESALDALGTRLSDVEQVVITHAHNDHFGAAAAIVRRSGARLVGSGGATMAGFPETFRANAEFRRGLFAESGAIDLAGDAWSGREGALRRSSDAVTLLHDLADGDDLAMGGDRWQVIGTPGHAGTAISLFEPRQQFLITGDILLGNGASNVTLYETPRPGRWALDIDRSLERLQAFGAVQAFPGHGPPIRDATRVIGERRARIARRLDQFAEFLAVAPESASAVARKAYPPAIAGHAVGIAQAIGYCEALCALGRAEWNLHDGLSTYRSTGPA
jgi:glyoxylase-like metal-dependent hydrolase (beta-lactamase superfamily II)